MTEDKLELDFLVLGAQKAGTTSLHEMLARHSEISLPEIKETHFFSHADRAALGRDWYEAQFTKRPNASLKGEIDPEYLYTPSAAANIRAKTNVSKFVIVLRHPLDRAFSQYQMSVRRGYEPLDFPTALEQEASRMAGRSAGFAQDHWSYAARSLYFEQIMRFLTIFPQSSFLYLRSDDLSATGYKRLCNFLGVKPLAGDLEQSPRLNAASSPRSTRLRNLLYAPMGKSKIRRFVTRAIPHATKRSAFLFLDKLNQRPVKNDREAQFACVPKSVLEAMVQDLRRVGETTKLDLADWVEDLEARLRRL